MRVLRKMKGVFIIFNLFLSAFAADNIISSWLLKPPYCQEPGKCTLSNNTAYCYGMELPYNYSHNSVIHNLTQEEAHSQLNYWKKILIRVPKCWAVVQPFLCTLFVPKCDDDMVVVPSKMMCEVIQNPCKIVISRDNWPFNCSLYKQDTCKNDVRELKFNTTGHCMNPLVATVDEFNYYEGVEGCGLQCKNPLFTDEERKTIQRIVMIGSTTAFISNLFAVWTFIIDWGSVENHPATLSIFFMNVCALMVSIGYVHQFAEITRNVVCYEDGILRKSEPRFQTDLSCVTNFVFVYYFFIAGIVWFVIYAYAWNLKFKAIERGAFFDKKVGRKAYYHLAAWSLPFIFTIFIMAMGEVDGDSLLGVCTVGVVNKIYRIVFVLGPMCCSAIGIVLLMKGVFFLLHLKFTSKDVIDSRGNSEITVTVIRVLVFSIVMTISGGVIFTYHIYDYLKDQEWKESLKNYIVCGLRSNIENCEMEHRPWMFLVKIYLIALFAGLVNMASWVVASTTLGTWARFVERVKKTLTNHQSRRIINRMHKNSKHLGSEGHVSISWFEREEDLVELNFESFNTTSGYSSSTCIKKALQKIIARRVALDSSSVSSQRQDSVQPHIDINLRRASELRRHSMDTTFSVR